MQKRAATGSTTASRVKALLLHAERQHGRSEADAFLLTTKLDRDYLADETRLIPLEIWHRALTAFASRWGRAEILRTAPCVVDSTNLGVWTRVLRGADAPAQAFEQLAHHGGDHGLTELWHTESSSPTSWIGSVTLGSDKEHELDGLCCLGRQAELQAVTTLFGLPMATVRVLDATEARQRFEVTWRTMSRVPLLVGGLAGAVTGFAASLTLPSIERLIVIATGAMLGTGAGYFVDRERGQRNHERAQLRRIQVLERAASLREARDRGAVGFQSGTVVAGQYRLGEKLGSGGSGSIWEAERLADGNVVAIKMLRTAVAHDTLAADRLRREAEALGLAWHPNVVEIYDEGRLPDGTGYLVMERLFGESLAVRLKTRGTLTPSALLPIAIQVCDALGAVHAAGVVHRDVKPSNIFLAQENLPDDGSSIPPSVALLGGERVKLLDFGVAQVEWAETRLTNAGAPLGTPGYMSPEQEQGLEIDPRSDIFSLGGVLYECLTGVAPPLSREAHVSEDAAAPHSSRVQRAFQAIDEDLRKLVEQAMAPLPRDRFRDARELRAALLALFSKYKAKPVTVGESPA